MKRSKIVLSDISPFFKMVLGILRLCNKRCGYSAKFRCRKRNIIKVIRCNEYNCDCSKNKIRKNKNGRIP